MKPKILMLAGFTKRDRHQVTTEVSNAIADSGGWIVDHTLFSNIAIAIRFSIPPQGLEIFQRRVTAADIRLADESRAALRQTIVENINAMPEITASLNITCLHDEPDLRRDVPAIPG